ncbi:hypothetical protein [Microbacterium sp. cx-59]|nr:hypothetical protein [Microbacterium sp. cx-59]
MLAGPEDVVPENPMTSLEFEDVPGIDVVDGEFLPRSGFDPLSPR